MARRYKQDKTIGPGGLRCPCCAPFHRGRSLKATKRFINRKYRRADKQELHKNGECYD